MVFFKSLFSRKTTPEDFVTACFPEEMADLPEDRDANLMNDVLAARACGAGADATAAARAAILKYPDLDMPYYWMAHFYGVHNPRHKEAFTVLNQGLVIARRKSYLCYEYGLVEYERNALEASVMWWIRSCWLQLKNGRSWTTYGPWLQLADIASILKLYEESSLFRMVSQQIRPLRNSPKALDKMNGLIERNSTRNIIPAMSSLHARYRETASREGQ